MREHVSIFMLMARRSFWRVFALIAVLAAAQSGEAFPAETPVPVTATPAPTSTPTPAATKAPTKQKGPGLKR